MPKKHNKRSTPPTTTTEKIILKPVYETAAAACRYGKVRKNHGLEILIAPNYQNYSLAYAKGKNWKTIQVPAPQEVNSFSDVHFNRIGYTLKLDFHGDGMYDSVGIPGAKNLAEWMLPLKIYHYQIIDGTLKFTLGAKQLSRKTLDKTLLNMSNNNNPVLAMDVVLEPKLKGDFGTKKQQILLARVLTRPSQMIESLKSSPTWSQRFVHNALIDMTKINDENEMKEVENCVSEMNLRRRLGGDGNYNFITRLSSLWHHIQYLKYPLMFTGFMYYLVAHQQMNTNITFYNGIEVPRLIQYGKANENVHNITAPGINQFLPPIPDNRSGAFKIGNLLGKLEQLQVSSKSNSTIFTNILDQIAGILNQPNGTITTIAQVTSILTRLENEEDALNLTIRKKVLSLFSIVNIIWLLAILGISISILPSIHYVLKPLRDFLERVARYVLENIIQPTIRRLHDYGIIECGMWTLCAWVILDSHRYYGPVAGRYLAITALCGSVFSMLYTTGRHFATLGKKYYNLRDSHEIKEQSIENILWYVAIAFLAGALHFKSDFLGFVSIGTMYYKLGFGGWAGRMCYAFGFDGENALYRNVLASFTILNGIVGLRVFQFNNLYQLLQPIQTPVSVFGSIVGNIGLLIISSLYFKDGRTTEYYVIRNGLMMSNLLYSYYVGTLFNISGLTNASQVFMVFYFWTKFSELHFENRWSPWLLILGTSLMLWRGSLYMHTNPDLLIDMFTKAM